MLRRVRRAVLGAVLALVAFASAGEAACAWVLWQYDESGWHYPVVVPQVSETRAEYEKSREELVNDWQTRGYNARSACLPDSVDPRAPKGGRAVMDDEDRRLIDSAGHRRYLFVCQELGAPGDAPKKLSTS